MIFATITTTARAIASYYEYKTQRGNYDLYLDIRKQEKRAQQEYYDHANSAPEYRAVLESELLLLAEIRTGLSKKILHRA